MLGLETFIRFSGPRRSDASFEALRLSDNMLALYRLFMNQPTFQMQGFQDHIAENKLSMYPPGLSLKSMFRR